MKFKKFCHSMTFTDTGGRSHVTSAAWVPVGHPLLPQLPKEFESFSDLGQAVFHSLAQEIFFVAHGAGDQHHWRWVYVPQIERAADEAVSKYQSPLASQLKKYGLFERRYATRREAAEDLRAVLLNIEVQAD